MEPIAIQVKVLADYIIRVQFSDRSWRDVDLEPELSGPMFEPLRDPDLVCHVFASDELGTIVWPNGADIAPETLYGSAFIDGDWNRDFRRTTMEPGSGGVEYLRKYPRTGTDS